MGAPIPIAHPEVRRDGQAETDDPSDEGGHSDLRYRESHGDGAGNSQCQNGALPGEEGALGLQARVEWPILGHRNIPAAIRRPATTTPTVRKPESAGAGRGRFSRMERSVRIQLIQACTGAMSPKTMKTLAE